MTDPMLKRLFGYPEVVEILVRDVLPDDADRIDLSTLRKLGTELVGEALLLRYPDMAWTARTLDGGHALILTEFQGRRDRLMALRTTIYAHLAVQELLRQTRPAPSPDTVEVLTPMLLYHGPGAWEGPTELDEVFPRGIPRNFLPIFGDPEGGGSGRAADLMGAMTVLDQDTSVVGTMVALATLRRIAAETGGRVGWLLVKCVGAWLVSKERITEEQYREATTMTQVMTAYERSLEEWAREKYAKEREQERAEGRAEGQRAERVAVLCRLAGRRFGAEAGERLADLFGTSPDAVQLARAEAAVIECATADELMRRVRG